MKPLNKLGVVFYFVSDWERAKKFYGETLGLEQRFSTDEGGWAEYSSGSDVSLAIHRTQPGMEVTRGGATAIFDVTNAEEAKAELEGRGIVFDGDLREIPGMVRLGTFRDPDGNAIQIAQDLTKNP